MPLYIVISILIPIIIDNMIRANKKFVHKFCHLYDSNDALKLCTSYNTIKYVYEKVQIRPTQMLTHTYSQCTACLYV